MKSLKNVLIILVSMVVFALAFNCRSVYATGGLVLNPGATTSNTTTNATANTTTNSVANTTANTTTNSVANTTTNSTTNTSKLNTSTTNNINSDVNKDLPQTGETDTYIIAGIGAVALAIGTIAFIKSRNV